MKIDNSLTLETLLTHIDGHFSKADITQYINNETKTIGVFIQLQPTGEYTYYIPVNPSNLDINIKAIINVDHIKWKSYQEIIDYSLDFNKQIKKKLINPINKIVNKDKFCVGILLDIGEIIPINPPTIIDDETKKDNFPGLAKKAFPSVASLTEGKSVAKTGNLQPIYS